MPCYARAYARLAKNFGIASLNNPYGLFGKAAKHALVLSVAQQPPRAKRKALPNATARVRREERRKAMSAELAVIDAPEKAVMKMETVDDMMNFLSDLKKLESLLKAAKSFHDKAVQYIKLEAATYARIAELGLVESVPSKNYQYKIVKWFTELDDDERKNAIARCGSEGITIRAFWAKQVHEPEMMEHEIKRMRELGDYAVEAFAEEGKVSIDDYFDRVARTCKRVPEDVNKAYKDSVRDRIRKLGGHGLGDGRGTYMTKEKATDAAQEIIANKIGSILADVERLREFVGDGAIELELSAKSNFNPEMSDESAANILLLLCGIGTACVKTQRSWTRAKMYSAILKRLGTTPYELFRDIVAYSKQFRPNLAVVTHIDLLDFGWDEASAEVTAHALDYVQGELPGDWGIEDATQLLWDAARELNHERQKQVTADD